MNKTQKSSPFHPILINSIDEALESLGEVAKESVYFLLKNNFLLKKQDIPNRIDDFSTAIEQVLGPKARQLKALIAKNLRKRVNRRYNKNVPDMLAAGLPFKEYIELARLCAVKEVQYFLKEPSNNYI